MSSMSLPPQLKQRRQSGTRQLLLAVGSAVLLGSFSVSAGQALRISVESDREQYVVREPVKLVVTLENTSNSPIHIPEVEYLGNNMEYMYYEIEYPHGKRQLRHFNYIQRFVIRAPNYEGELLEGGQRITTALYPNVTRVIGSEDATGRLEATFPVAGQYRLKVHYYVPEYRQRLWRPPGGETSSAPIALRFREATREESEILDVIWAGNDGPGVGDNEISIFDDAMLRRVIRKYPDNPMTNHARLALVMTLIRNAGSTNDQTEATKVLRDLMAIAPDFRFDEVRQHLATAYWRLGDRTRAIDILDSTLANKPELKDDFVFMAYNFMIKFEGNSEPLKEWRRCRRVGDQFDESQFLYSK